MDLQNVQAMEVYPNKKMGQP